MKNKLSLPIFLIFLIISFLTLVAGIILTRQRQIVQKKAAGGQNASLYLPSSLASNINQELSIPIMLNTDGVEIIGVDVVLNFDKNYLEFIDAIPGTAFATYLPVDDYGNFNRTIVKNIANSTGKIEVGAVAFNWTNEQITAGFNGVLGEKNPLFVLKFRTKQPGQTSVNFSFTPGSTTDSNLVRINSDQNQDILSQVTNLYLTINAPTPTNTPTPTRTPTPTPTPTSTPPTPAPTPSPKPTLTPTPTPGSANLTLKLKFQGINQQRSAKTVRVILKQQEQEKYRFDTLVLNSDVNGVYSATIRNIIPGIYDVYIKGWAHLQKKFGNVNLTAGTNIKDWTATILKAGDAIANNRVDIYDYNLIVEHFGSKMPTGGSNADFDLDGDVDIFDYNLLVSNFNQTGE